jgi:hypothetical protein
MRKLLLFAAALSGIATIGAVTSPAHATLSESTNTPGTIDLAEFTTTETGFTNSTTAPVTITINPFVTGFTQPLAGIFSETLTASYITDDTGTGDSIMLVSSIGANVLPAVSVTLTSTSMTASASASVDALSAPYDIAQSITFTLGPGDGIQWMTEAQVRVPEPMSAALLASGLVGVGWLRRRRTVK